MNMEAVEQVTSPQPRCSECGAEWPDGLTCTDHFHQMLAWEFDHQLFDMHHLMVLCYHLQHPGLYSQEFLPRAQQMLVEFLEEGVTTEAMRRRLRDTMNSGKREFKVAGTPENYGVYTAAVSWEMRANDVTRVGASRYYASVAQWAESTLCALRASGNLG